VFDAIDRVCSGILAVDDIRIISCNQSDKTQNLFSHI